MNNLFHEWLNLWHKLFILVSQDNFIFYGSSCGVGSVAHTFSLHITFLFLFTFFLFILFFNFIVKKAVPINQSVKNPLDKANLRLKYENRTEPKSEPSEPR